ncbi:MAG: triose-phosphate isomerase [Deltaproteobacteria bacterium]|nr:triose-phosphate isomerase [Deltaproteobacteria bacterium]
MARKPFICGNWKMNTTVREGATLAVDVARLCARHRSVEVAAAPPFTHLEAVGKRLEDGPVQLAAQNVHFEAKGAFTGEVSAPMLKSLGVKHVIVGHSERRQFFGETDETVNRRVQAILGEGLSAIACVGETLDEREAGTTLEVVERQVRGALAGVGTDQAGAITIAYEPVWAIGTGRTATPEQAQDVHAAIRGLLAEIWDRPTAEDCRIQYGGSMKPENAAELLSKPDVDGGLIGGAALDAESFAAIVAAAAESVA